MLRPWLQQRTSRTRVLLLGALVLGACLTGVAQAASEPGEAAPLGVQLRFESLLERREQRARGQFLELGTSLRIPTSLAADAALRHETHYSPHLQVVFELRSPGYLPGAPEYYLYDGAYFVYTPRPFADPGLDIEALPRSAHQERVLLASRRTLAASLHRRSLQEKVERQAGQGFEVTVVNSLPGPLSTMFGRDATTIRVTGRESISFAGESRRVSPYIANEQGRGQSLFPRLDMDQDLQVKLEGSIGGKVHVAVDHNSNVFGIDANRVNVWYEGYADDIVRRIDLGGTNLVLPGSRLVTLAGLSQGVFGVKTDMRLGGFDLTMLAAKEETEAETRTLTPSGGSATVVPINEVSYLRDRFFFYELPDSNSAAFYASYGLDPGAFVDNVFVPGQLFEQDFIPFVRVFIDDRNQNTEVTRPFQGYAVANLPAGLDQAQMDAAYNGAQNTERWPTQDPGVNLGDPNFRISRWRELGDEELGWVYYDFGGKKLVLGFFLRSGPLGSDHVLAASFEDPRGAAVGNVQDQAPALVHLRLIRHPDQDKQYHLHPTSLLMMRHVYYMSATDIQDLEVAIESRDTGNPNPEVPLTLQQSTFLHMFGLDELDQNNRPYQPPNPGGPDGRFDTSRSNLWDRENGYLFLPGLRPFSPPDAIVVRRLESAGVSPDSALAFRDRLFGSDQTVPPTLYTLPDRDPTTPQNLYRILVQTTGTGTEIFLPQDIVEGSDVVRLDGRTLARGVDYDIEAFAGGKITFKGDVLTEISPSSRIEVSYAFRPLLGTGQATLLGASGKYDLGSRGSIASVWLWESRRSFARQPQLGDEPSTNLVGDVNTSLRFQPRWMTRLVDLLPFTRTSAASGLAMAAEAAVSFPNPNTKNTAFVEDMESADSSDRLSNGREAWYWPSIPLDSPSAAREDTLNRIPTAHYNPSGRVKRGHLNPLLPRTEAQDGLTVLEIGFDRTAVRDLLNADPSRGPQLWGGVMTAFAGNGLDLTQTKTLELWFNDYNGIPATRRGRMHIDFGDISEDFVFFPNNPSRTNLQDNPRFNREAFSEFQFIPNLDDLGWNGKTDNCANPSGDWPRGEDCHIPSRSNSAGQHPWANGTELDNRYDTEDINSDGEWDTKNSFFRLTLDLADSTLVDPGTDISPLYFTDPNIDASLKPGFGGWRRYRLSFENITLDTLVAPGQTEPSLRQIRYVRIWFDDPQAPLDPNDQLWTNQNFQLYDFKFTGNQWLQLGVFGVDSTRVEGDLGEDFAVGVINNKDNPEYTIPPDAELIDTAGAQAREQSLRINFANLQPGHEMVAQKTNAQGRPNDYTLYEQMNFFTNFQQALGDTVLLFFRMGTDSLNFYEVARPLRGNEGWRETVFSLRSLTDLKFPDDIGVAEDTLQLGDRSVVQVTRQVPDLADPAVQLTMTRRGNPSLKQVGRLFVGVRHPSRDPMAFPLGGEVWFNNVRVEDPKREVGVAQLYGVTGNFADVLDFTVSYSQRDAEFLGLRQRTGSGSETVSFQNRFGTNAARLVPTLGFNIPFSYTAARDLSRPKFFTSSDTENDATRAEEQRTESVRRTYGFSINRNPSKLFLFKPTLDRLTFSYNEAHNERRTYTTRDTSVSWSQNLQYDLTPKPHPFPVGFKQRLNLLPTNLKFGVQHQSNRGVSYTTTGSGPLVPRPPSGLRNLSLTASAAMRPLDILNLRYNLNEGRDYRGAHAANEAERWSVLGFDMGIPTGRGEAFSFDVNPRFVQYSYGSNYSDRRTLLLNDQTGAPLPDVHQLVSNTSHRLSFDFKLHRRLARLAGAGPARPPLPPPETLDPQAEDAPQEEPAVPDTSRAEQPAPAARPKRFPNPVKALLRFAGGIEPVKVEWNGNRTASYVGAPEEARYFYRLGFSTDTGIPGFDVPSPLNKTRSLNLSSAVPLRGALRVTVRYGQRSNDIETRTGRDSTLRVNINSTDETAFPSLELNINDLQKLRIFGPRLQRSTLSLSMSRTLSERVSRDFFASGETRESNPRESEARIYTANWTAQWSGNTASTLSLNQNSGAEKQPGQRVTNLRRAIQGTLRFKVAPRGGLSLPWLGKLKTGIDCLVNGGYTTDEGEVFNNPFDPEDGTLTRRSSLITGGIRGDYNLSRNMTGGVEISYSRNRDDKNNQTIGTLRLGFNLTFLF